VYTVYTQPLRSRYAQAVRQWVVVVVVDEPPGLRGRLGLGLGLRAVWWLAVVGLVGVWQRCLGSERGVGMMVWLPVAALWLCGLPAVVGLVVLRPAGLGPFDHVSFPVVSPTWPLSGSVVVFGPWLLSGFLRCAAAARMTTVLGVCVRWNRSLRGLGRSCRVKGSSQMWCGPRRWATPGATPASR
jgi:hypothetical protein